MPAHPDAAGSGGIIKLPVWKLQTPPLKGHSAVEMGGWRVL